MKKSIEGRVFLPRAQKSTIALALSREMSPRYELLCATYKPWASMQVREELSCQLLEQATENIDFSLNFPPSL